MVIPVTSRNTDLAYKFIDFMIEYENSLTNVGTRMVQYVPKALLVYQGKKVEVELKRLTARLMTVPEDEQAAILVEITTLNKMKTRLNNELGRV